eukprot:m.69812 g.69812  ORF g.69812 m.69812 type:complete len:88 (+) comp12091_c0_seq1:1531-1794(+)
MVFSGGSVDVVQLELNAILLLVLVVNVAVVKYKYTLVVMAMLKDDVVHTLVGDKEQSAGHLLELVNGAVMGSVHLLGKCLNANRTCI